MHHLGYTRHERTLTLYWGYCSTRNLLRRAVVLKEQLFINLFVGFFRYMFYQFLYPWHETISAFNLFKYITFRSIGASVTAFLICLLLNPLITRFLSQLSAVGSTEREHAGSIHKFYSGKKHVPTMGGILIVLAIVISCFFWGNWQNSFFVLSLVTIIWFALIGFWDDYLKVIKKDTKGLRSKKKLAGQLIWGLFVGLYIYWSPEIELDLYIPFFKDLVLPLGILYIPFAILVLTGSSNALNLTDGMDGLAIGCLCFAAAAFAILSYVSGHILIADYLQIPFHPENGELTVLCAALVGAGVGFLWFNCYPASIFMGDTGSLALGGGLGAVALFTKMELLLPIIGGVFVWEALSVILQVASFQWRGKRIFRMAPFHHHLQLGGWEESKVTIRFWIIAFILALIGLGTLKIR